ncbi:MAG: helix-turn-helix domain-containing protein [Proteobacteria bacterium]|jgi:excisionase family DNA binding protein|nr:helix-turn-helix domain-containing protein [Pseudomonadota bacterium]
MSDREETTNAKSTSTADVPLWEHDADTLKPIEENDGPCEPPPIATVAEIARYLRVHSNHVYSMFAQGKIPGGKRIGKSIRFRTKTVVEWLESDQAESSGRSRKRGAA